MSKDGTIRSIPVDKDAKGDINNCTKIYLKDITKDLNNQDRDYDHEPESITYFNSEIHVIFKAIRKYPTII